MDSKKQAQGIASLGRYGDTTLMHMRPDEVAQLTAISRANGGDITINPDTGMPEAFLGDFFSALAPTAAGLAAGAIFPGAYAPYLAAGAGGLTAYAQGKRDPLGIAMGALGGYGGGNIGQGLVAQGGAPAVPAGAAESQFTPFDTSKGINMSTGQTVGGSTFTPGATTVAGGPSSLTTAGGQGFTGGMTPQQVYKPVNTTIGPNMGRVEPIPRAQGFDATLDTKFDAASNAPRPVYNQNVLTQTNQQALPPLTEEAGKSPLQQGFEYSQGQLSKLGSGIKNVVTDSEARKSFFESPTMGAGNETYGMFKTAMPVLGAGAETYMKGMYEDMPTYEQSTAGLYDPTRRLNLGMDTGLRLLAQGGEVKKYAEGDKVVRDQSYYGITPKYQTSYSYSGPYGMMGGTQVQTRVPVMGFVDVGGKFVADPKGNITDVEYEDRFKYVTEGVAKPEDESGGDFEARAGLQGAAGGINPAVALQAAQGYADSQQSDLNQQGLGTLKTGGSVRRFQMGGTTAEENKQNIQSMYGEPGKTTAEQNLSRDAIQEAGTVVTQQMGNDLAKRAGETFSKLPVVPGDANNNMAKILGVALQSNPQAFTVVPNTSTTPQGLTALNLNTGRQEPTMGMAAGGIAGLTPDDGKMLNGNGDGVSDEIPAMIEGEQEAALSDGEFIVPARIVSELGNGSSDAGAQKLYAMIDRIQAARSKTMGDNKEYAKDTNAERYLPA